MTRPDSGRHPAQDLCPRNLRHDSRYIGRDRIHVDLRNGDRSASSSVLADAVGGSMATQPLHLF